eukprot:m.13886 g.13886  ORF g.13886 m.13886 type:complete len:719 (+) comp3099_c0_seq1:169-2325(+)
MDKELPSNDESRKEAARKLCAILRKCVTCPEPGQHHGPEKRPPGTLNDGVTEKDINEAVDVLEEWCKHLQWDRVGLDPDTTLRARWLAARDDASALILEGGIAPLVAALPTRPGKPDERTLHKGAAVLLDLLCHPRPNQEESCSGLYNSVCKDSGHDPLSDFEFSYSGSFPEAGERAWEIHNAQLHILRALDVDTTRPHFKTRQFLPYLERIRDDHEEVRHTSMYSIATLLPHLSSVHSLVDMLKRPDESLAAAFGHCLADPSSRVAVAAARGVCAVCDQLTDRNEPMPPATFRTLCEALILATNRDETDTELLDSAYEATIRMLVPPVSDNSLATVAALGSELVALLHKLNGVAYGGGLSMDAERILRHRQVLAIPAIGSVARALPKEGLLPALEPVMEQLWAALKFSHVAATPTGTDHGTVGGASHASATPATPATTADPDSAAGTLTSGLAGLSVSPADPPAHGREEAGGPATTTTSPSPAAAAAPTAASGPVSHDATDAERMLVLSSVFGVLREIIAKVDEDFVRFVPHLVPLVQVALEHEEHHDTEFEWGASAASVAADIASLAPAVAAEAFLPVLLQSTSYSNCTIAAIGDMAFALGDAFAPFLNAGILAVSKFEPSAEGFNSVTCANCISQMLLSVAVVARDTSGTDSLLPLVTTPTLAKLVRFAWLLAHQPGAGPVEWGLRDDILLVFPLDSLKRAVVGWPHGPAIELQH